LVHAECLVYAVIKCHLLYQGYNGNPKYLGYAICIIDTKLILISIDLVYSK
jgi:hypothetical protein